MGNFIEWEAVEQKRTLAPLYSSDFKETYKLHANY